MLRLSLLLFLQLSSSFDGEERDIVWPSVASATGSAGVGTALQFTGDGVLDAFTLDGTRLYAFYGVGTYDAVVDTGLDLDTLAPLPPDTPGGAGALLGTDATGLLRIDPALPTGFAASAVRTGGGWSSSLRLRTAQLDGAWGRDVVSLGAGGSQVDVLYDGPFGLGSDVSFPTLRAGLDVAVLDWDGLGGPEIAVLNSTGVYVFDQAGALVATLTKPAGSTTLGGLAVLSSPGENDRLAWRSESPVAALVHVDRLGAVGASWVDVTGASVVALAAADYDVDGADELLLSRDDLPRVELYDPVAGPAQQALPDAFVFSLSGGPGAVTAEPIAGDVDGDGDVDVLLPWDAGGVVEVFYGTALDQTPIKPAIQDDVFPTFDPNTGAATFVVAPVGGGYPTGATHLEIKAHYRADLAQDVQPDHPSNAVSYEALSGASQTVSTTFALDPVALDVLHVTLRAVERSGSTTLHAWPATTAVFAGDFATFVQVRDEPDSASPILALLPPGVPGGGETGGWNCKPSHGPFPVPSQQPTP
ncbi:MAG: hypothetical protein AAF682_23140 [Planctomycetota bacterium]